MNPGYTRATEAQYARNLLGGVRRYFNEAYDWANSSLLSIPEWFEAFAHSAARQMITQVYATNARSWREAAREASRGKLIYAALENELKGPVGLRYRELIAENAKLIKSLPQKVAAQVAAKVAAAGREGKRAEGYPGEGLLRHVSRSHARLIARTETAKASAALTQARAEELELPWYGWETSRDERVRASHRKMQGVLIRYSDPPSPEALVGERSNLGHYHAGNAPNDRCYQAPLMSYDQVNWPHRVYLVGHIQWMTLARFKLLNQRRASAA